MKQTTIKLKQTTIIAVILGVFLVFSAIQAFQLNSLKTKVTEGQLDIGSSGSKKLTSSGSGKTTELPSSIKDLPQMVGGC